MIGSDFELFIKSGEQFICAIPFIDGDKENPQKISEQGHAIQADGALFEANVPPVTLKESEKMWEDIQFVIEAGKERLPKGLEIVCCTNGAYDDTELEDPKARMGGCDPDYSAWSNGTINKKPNLETNNNRCCGFHLHVSFKGADVRSCMRLIRIMDVNLAIPLLFIDEDRDRRKLYGKAGCFRFKDYNGTPGVEYRSLSNVVIKNKEVFDYCFAQLVKAVDDYNEGVDYLQHGTEIQECINTYNLDMAEQLYETLKLSLPDFIKQTA